MSKIDENMLAGKKMLADIVETCVELKEDKKKLETRIDIMQELIDYNEWIVQNALKMMEVWDNDEAFKYLEECYAIGDEPMYEAMEKADEEESDLYD